MDQHGGAAMLLHDGTILLGFALVFVLLFRKLGLGATLGYLIAGAVVGPYALGLVGNAEEMAGIAELGITLLLFIVGLELAPGRLWALRHEIFGLGLLQVTLCGLALSAFIYLVTTSSAAAALALGLPLGLSSTAQVLPMLQGAGRLQTPFGQRAFAVLLFQDLSIIPLITIVAALSRNPAIESGPSGWQLALYTAGAIVTLIAAGRFLVRPLFRLISVLGERELFVAAALFAVIAASALMQALGLSTALGAFIAGVMLADTPFRHELEADVEPFRSILLGLFFVTVGMMLDLGAIAEHPLFVFMMAAGLIGLKAGIVTGLGLLFRMEWRGALALGLLLSQGGEFGFVLFALAQDALLVDPAVASLFAAVVTLSMVTTPFLMLATRRIRRPRAEGGDTREEPDGQTASALVVGYGRFGQTVAQTLIAAGVSVTLIDRNAGLIDRAGEFGAKVYFGDGMRMDLLRQAGAGEADLLLFCLDGDPLTPEFLAGVAEAFPRPAVFGRVFDRLSLIRLADAPIDHAIREVLESAMAMARRALAHVGLDGRDIASAEAEYRQTDTARLDQQIAAGDVMAGRDTIYT